MIQQAELSQVKIAMAESHRLEILRMQQEHEEHIGKMKVIICGSDNAEIIVKIVQDNLPIYYLAYLYQDELDQLKELLRTYETSVERKDQVISNLTRAVQTGHDRLEMSKRLMQWKLRMMDERRQVKYSYINQFSYQSRNKIIIISVFFTDVYKPTGKEISRTFVISKSLARMASDGRSKMERKSRESLSEKSGGSLHTFDG